MPFRFQRKEPIAEGVQRIADELLQNAVCLLQSSEKSSDDVVHDVRTSCKKLRGLARLMRLGLGDRYQTFNRTFRDEAHTLSTHRDADVLASLWCEVAVEFEGDLPLQLGALFHSTVAGRTANSNEQTPVHRKQTFQEMAGRLEEYRRSHAWRPVCDDEACLLQGMTTSYRSARKALQVVQKDASTLALHELRKRTKDHWYQMRLLRNIWRPLMQPRVDICANVSDELGTDHDLALFEEVLAEMEAAPEHVAYVDKLQRHVHRRRRVLQCQAIRQCEYLYAEKPKRFCQRIAAYWQIWRGRR